MPDSLGVSSAPQSNGTCAVRGGVGVGSGFSHKLKWQSRGFSSEYTGIRAVAKPKTAPSYQRKAIAALIRSFGSVVGLGPVSGWLSDSGIVRLSSKGVPQGRALESVKFRGQDSNKGRLWRPLVRVRLNAPSRHPSEGRP